MLAALILLATAPAAAAQTGPAPPDGTAAEHETAIGMVLARHAESDCEDPASDHMKRFRGIASTLSPTATLFAIPCTASGANTTYRLYVRESGEVGGVTVLYFATWSKDHGWSGTDLLYNIALDGPRLTAHYKASAKGDCGTYGEWTWTGYAYRLDRFAVEERCQGRRPADWRRVYPAS